MEFAERQTFIPLLFGNKVQTVGLGPNFENYSVTIVRTDRCLVFCIVLAVVIYIPETIRYSATRGLAFLEDLN